MTAAADDYLAKPFALPALEARLAALFSAIGGFWLAGKAIAPVTELARRVGELPPGERAGNLAQHFAADDVGELARAVDDYTERLADAMEREQAFTGDVSHELCNACWHFTLGSEQGRGTLARVGLGPVAGGAASPSTA